MHSRRLGAGTFRLRAHVCGAGRTGQTNTKAFVVRPPNLRPLGSHTHNKRVLSMPPFASKRLGGPIKVAIVTPTMSRAGGGIFPIVIAQARELSARADMNVTVYALDDDPDRLDWEEWRALDIRIYSSRFGGISLNLLRDVLASEADVIHQHGLWLFPSAAVSALRRQQNVPVVISTQGMLEPWAVGNSAVKKRIAAALFERANLSAAAAIHCSAAEVAGVRAFGVQSPIAAIPNGVDLPGLDLPALPSFMSKQKRTLLFLGRIHPKKGIRELLEAVAKLHANAPMVAAAWQVAIVGWDDGGHSERLKAHADTLGLSSNVVFPGPLFGEDKRAALLNADAFVLPSYSEGFPMAVLEAWAHALPVLMTRECNVPDGFAVGAAVEITTNPDELAVTLAQILADPALADIGRCGRNYVTEHYAWPAIAQDLAAVYHWLTGASEKPGCIVTV